MAARPAGANLTTTAAATIPGYFGHATFAERYCEAHPLCLPAIDASPTELME